MDLTRINYSSGAPLEEKTGYSRMVKVGPFIYIGGTTAVQPDGTVFSEESAYEQAKYIFEKLVKLLEKAGSKKEEVIRIKGYTTDMKYGAEIARAYSEIFFEVKPLFTMIGTPMLNRPTQLVEIEMDAAIGCKVE
ncbi:MULTISPECIES: Rid family hydrolase [Clostridium]|jgi:enamine deaminase RidA (YjgF/YER057c/UK114 family)|uniref:Endoribonuclease L-PSP n=1 Tax=Clostridium saccharoperbutylacetonicum N1-4(HMT) TaxID=931276 RepID=M1LZE5_9CLOT|nr:MULTISPECIES: Rid family hydrolase [Clostridium]AGF58660.1 endoribonuclease L-PSP [Clostridium saccharoperbutylacetonicum N1-4(HMT)]AQR97351.1 2-iminobutanoate/2-iminopropanoate deaminase [Clostridium saccharoperbutylacetonicum]NRT60561.1 enamine deaminase RidA (YjgF/YER057c/UK114 family) [Clostridium saccharoperbutylacetonicum]NSB23875.1 enamine deaminase RidA (YjgF/YER057c/UK114 family) [Clostridium saccharoperbutylacetonicum]NSB33234.1 enamine deaminase RidA (YjgF/YER057c/UK114 family) [